ncbi:MAG: ABC transporter permease [Elusimicrobiota bacterium]|jgi:ABC-type transport system involved in multi-copper enzyme maturation permease subunit
MRKILGIIRYTFIEILRNKVYYVLLLFAGMLILSAMLLGSLGGEQKARMIIDMGLASIELLCLIIAVFAAVTLILEEMESRTLYLVLTRPVARYQFILGRFLGLVAVLSVTYLIMAGGHLTLLATNRIHPDAHYALSLFYSWEKVVLITSLALFFSLFSTSTVSAVAFTLFFWIMGHFSHEMLSLGRRAGTPLVLWICNAFYYLTPNFQVMNLRDFSPAQAGLDWLWAAAGYGLSYTLVCLSLTVFLFRKREF